MSNAFEIWPFAYVLLGPEELESFTAGAPDNTDDNARIEFAAPRDLLGYAKFEPYRANVYGPERIRRSVDTWYGYRGWESDPELAPRLTFVQGDMYQADISKASPRAASGFPSRFMSRASYARNLTAALSLWPSLSASTTFTWIRATPWYSRVPSSPMSYVW